MAPGIATVSQRELKALPRLACEGFLFLSVLSCCHSFLMLDFFPLYSSRPKDFHRGLARPLQPH